MRRLVFAAVLSLLCRPPVVHAQGSGTLIVFAAASLTDAFTTLGRRYEKAHPGVRVAFDFAGSQQLAARLEQGAVADVFASADTRWMEFVKRKGLLTNDAQRFARNQLVLIVPRTNPARLDCLQDLERPGVKLVLCSDAVPAGRYARQALRNLGAGGAKGFSGDYPTHVLANVVSEEENVRAVVGKVVLGEADAGFVYRSDVTANSARYVKVIEIPSAANVVAEYPLAVLKDAPRPRDAQAFVDLVLSEEGQRILRSAGFLTCTQTGEPLSAIAVRVPLADRR